MMLAQQLSGINCAMFYSTSIFSTAGLNPTQSQSATLGMGAMNVAMTFVSLALIEKAGRKVLMVSGLSLMLCMTILLLASLLTFETVPTMSYVAIVAVITFVVGFATGPGSIPWFFVTELFAQSGRPTATSIASPSTGRQTSSSDLHLYLCSVSWGLTSSFSSWSSNSVS